jgi:hypothetical protein
MARSKERSKGSSRLSIRAVVWLAARKYRSSSLSRKLKEEEREGKGRNEGEGRKEGRKGKKEGKEEGGG